LNELLGLLRSGKLPLDASIDRKYGYNALQLAAMINQYPLIEVLLLYGANINQPDRFGNTPLMLAVSRHNHEAIHSLLKNGCDM
jgi:ankyrin repeat protein